MKSTDKPTPTKPFRPSRQVMEASASHEAREAAERGYNTHTNERTFWAAPSDSWIILEDMEMRRK